MNASHLKADFTDRPPFPLIELPRYQWYMPEIVLWPVDLVGDHTDEAEDIRCQFLQSALYAADQWHRKVDEMQAAGKFNQEKCDDVHTHIANASRISVRSVNSSYWLSIKEERRDPYLHRLIRDYLAANVTKPPRRKRNQTSDQATVDQTPTFNIGADQFFVNGAIQEPGLISTAFETTNAHIIYGPYLPFPVGSYSAVFDLTYKCPVSTPSLLLTLDAVVDGSIVAEKTIDSSKLFYDKAPPSLTITVSNPEALVEFRVFVSGSAYKATMNFTGIRLFEHLS